MGMTLAQGPWPRAALFVDPVAAEWDRWFVLLYSLVKLLIIDSMVATLSPKGASWDLSTRI
jgi:hypothetical protein